MTVFQSDRASADLTLLEEGALKGLASLGYNPTVGDLAEFCQGFIGATDGVGDYAAKLAFQEDVRLALVSLDALGWAVPESGEPLTSERWYVSGQGRVALEGVRT